MKDYPNKDQMYLDTNNLYLMFQYENFDWITKYNDYNSFDVGKLKLLYTEHNSDVGYTWSGFRISKIITLSL